jgi:hypothetical protein
VRKRVRIVHDDRDLIGDTQDLNLPLRRGVVFLPRRILGGVVIQEEDRDRPENQMVSEGGPGEPLDGRVLLSLFKRRKRRICTASFYQYMHHSNRYLLAG